MEIEDEGEYEYASSQHGESGEGAHYIESGVLYQQEAFDEGATHPGGSATPLCEAVAEESCGRLVPDDNSPDVEHV